MVAVSADIILAAKASQKATSIPASVSIAQYGLESGWGQHMPPGSNNPFGMKVRNGKDDPFVEIRTREVIKGKEVYVVARFRKFPSIADAFIAHGELLLQPVYAKARTKLPDPDAFADALTGVYATDPNYGKLLKQIMKGSNLYKYNT
jgi:flagellum-specific peptidoglycan hydrolase FlgJ